MTESEYIDKLKLLQSQEASPELLVLAEQAVSEFPNSAKLWCIRGNLIQLSSIDAGYELEEALRSYEKAVSVDPKCSEAYEEIGYFYDTIMDAPKAAEPFFQKAIEFGAGAPSYHGLARVLAELNRAEEAVKLLSAENCSYHATADIVELIDEIRAGTWSDKGHKNE